ncbi:MAG: PrsW family intramembrane metalloprotease [Verrucomicrobiaceae bacterium]|nr:PrsW family intramembrane metalloprotease [Verrucomicrobiaceae bacterium]
MSERKPPLHGWRTRVFHLTRDRRWLLRTAAGIAVSGLAIASFIVLFTGRDAIRPTHSASPSPPEKRLKEDATKLRTAAEASPRDFCAWLCRLGEYLRHEADEEAMPESTTLALHADYIKNGKLAGYELHPFIEKHGREGLDKAAADYLDVTLLQNGPQAEKALKSLESAAHAQPPAPFANELIGSLMLQRDEDGMATEFFIAEGAAFPDAQRARRRAVQTAIHTENADHMRLILAQPGAWIETCTPDEQYQAGAITGDVWLQWRGLFWDHFTDIPWLLVAFTILSGTIWWFILVQHDEKSPWRWLWPVLPLLAGVASVWPVLTVSEWQKHTLGMDRDSTVFVEQARYFLLGVGMREELCKLALFSLFLPWLLRTRSPARALLCAAFVGLGFAAEENVQYFHRYGIQAAFTRLLTANFMHLSLTGMAGHALYALVRSGFRGVEHFLGIMAFVILAHGAYDLLAVTDVIDLGGWLSIVLFLVIADRFIDELARESVQKRSNISLRAAFTLGCAVLVAAVFITAAIQGRSMTAVAHAGQSCLAVFPLIFLYWRRFEHA